MPKKMLQPAVTNAMNDAGSTGLKMAVMSRRTIPIQSRPARTAAMRMRMGMMVWCVERASFAR